MKFSRYLVLFAPFLSIAFPILLAAQENLISRNESTDVSGVKLFYRGDYDGETVTASNGAIVNKGYHAKILRDVENATKVLKVTEGVYTIVGYSLSNYTFIEGKTGLIAFDSGNNMGMGKAALSKIREVTDKKVQNIIYSHHHYTNGSRAYQDDAGEQLNVYAHPNVENLIKSTSLTLGPMQIRRAGIQLGYYLPEEGPDAYFGPAEPTFDDPALSESGHLTVTHPVKNGQTVVIDGVKAVFYHIIADSRDSLVVHFPDLDLILHNAAITNTAFPLYTLRGDYYRRPKELIAGIDIIRQIKPTYLHGAHGKPIRSKQEAYEIATAHRDLYSFIYNQSVRAINLGMTPDEMVNTIRIPEHLDQHPWLFPAYIDNEYSLRGQYRGMVGWYDEDTAELHPPLPGELASVLIEGFGGIDNMIAAAQRAFDQRKYNLSAKLLSFALDGDEDNKDARMLKAKALRAMAHATRTGIQTRNFMLTHARHLEGKQDWTKQAEHSIMPPPTFASLEGLPVGSLVEILETQIDPARSSEINKVIRFAYSDVGEEWAIHVRRGVAEVSTTLPESVDASLSITRGGWIRIALKQTSLEQEIKGGSAVIGGDPASLASVLSVFQ
ncbi:alkyl sulfatase dimerization domain-containing protein [Pseudohalioglobus lutimaris]|uniref:MBL fold metallo-hydrolase n=1 Tax=Pseudohalioglobus lutimaris TaxID=1737061 RepID=A0A2N5X2P1_9GAMM|nr:alkyl sulfatase dimerization domain-containing protein [Pseudohalioglobus lutimaris]PLW68749.1 MBL fold metallo-hydrolase [Pseudohalioglobus lutimaris]